MPWMGNVDDRTRFEMLVDLGESGVSSNNLRAAHVDFLFRWWDDYPPGSTQSGDQLKRYWPNLAAAWERMDR